MTQAVIGNLRATLGLDTAAFTAGAARAEKTLSGLQRSVATFGTGVAGVLGGIGLSALATSMVTAMRQVAQIGDLGETIGITAEQIQVFNRMALASGASTDVMARGLQEIAEQSADASSKLSQLFAENGLSAQGRETNEVIRDFMELLQNARDPTEQLAMATSVLGARVGRELVEALRTGAEGYDSAVKSMIESGNYHTNAEVKRIQEIETKYNEVVASIGAAWQGMIVNIIGGIDKIQKDFSSGGGSAASELFNLLTGRPVTDWDLRTGQPIDFWTGEPLRGLKGDLPGGLPPESSRAPSIFPSRPAPQLLNAPNLNNLGLGGGGSGGSSGVTPITAYDIRGVGLELQNFTGQVKEADIAAKDLATSLGDGIAYALTDIAFNAKSAGDAFQMLKAVALDTLESITQQLLKSGLNMLLSGLGSSFGGAQGLAGFGGFYADGGTLGAGKWGIAGEAGPEIIHGPANITPMGRGGASPQMNVTIINNSSASVSTRKNQGGDLELMIEDMMASKLSRGGNKIDSALQRGYGLKRAGR